nr:hypothetical protein [Paraburkholderia gardini]
MTSIPLLSPMSRIASSITLGDEPLVFKMPDDDHKTPDAVTMKFAHRVADRSAQRRAVDTRGTAEMLTAAAPGL